MKQVPAKQIYLLFVIIVGIVALSVYSTYALFTFESTTGDIVSIHIPKSLTISENVYEYQQIKIGPNQVVTTDVDIYNSFEYETCYSVWYKALGEIEEQSKVQVFEQNEKSLSSSGTLEPNAHLRINIIIINDNDKEIKINLGTIGSSKQNDQCSLNLSSDKNTISIAHSSISLLTASILNNLENKQAKTESYLIHDMKNDYLRIEKNQKLYISDEFSYANEIFNLTSGMHATIEEYLTKKQEELEKNETNEENEVEQEVTEELDIEEISIENKYFCLDTNECNILYQVQSIEETETEYLIHYNKLIGYLTSENGLKKVGEKDYVYYGDNPDNYIYFNCKNIDDVSSCELWRIVGLIYNEENDNYDIKIVRNDSIGDYQYDYKMIEDENKTSNNWNESTLNKYLNEEFKLNSGNQYLVDVTQNLEVIKNLEIEKTQMNSEEISNSKFNILKLSDYLNSSSCNKNKINEYDEICFKNNWLNNIEVGEEWTMTSKEVEIPIIEEPEIEDIPTEDEVIDDNESIDTEESKEDETEIEVPEEEIDEEKQYIINYVYSVNNKIQESDVTKKLSVRPVVYLKARMVLISGDGSFSSPYMVK